MGRRRTKRACATSTAGVVNVEYYRDVRPISGAELRRLPHAQGGEARRRAGARRRRPRQAERLRPRRRSATCRCRTRISASPRGSATPSRRPAQMVTPQAASPYITSSNRAAACWSGRSTAAGSTAGRTTIFRRSRKVGDLKSLRRAGRQADREARLQRREGAARLTLARQHRPRLHRQHHAAAGRP